MPTEEKASTGVGASAPRLARVYDQRMNKLWDEALKQALASTGAGSTDPPEGNAKGSSWLDKLVAERLADLPKPIDVFRPSAAFNFDDVRQAVAMVERAIEQQKKETKISADHAMKAAAADPFHSFTKNPVFAPMAVAFWRVETTFPLILRRSLLVAVYSHVEHVLHQWCVGLHAEWSLPMTYRKFRDKQPKRPTPVLYLLYLRDQAGIALGTFDSWPEWNALDRYREARNCIAHDGGLVENAGKQVLIEALPHVLVDRSGLLNESPTIVLGPGACEAAVDAAERFFERLWSIYAQDPRIAPRLSAST